MWSAIVALIIAAATLAVTWSSIPYHGSDSEQYIELAEGRPENTIKPFSGRILYPTLVRTLKATGLSTDGCFVVAALLALIILPLTISLRVMKGAQHWFMLVPVLLTPFLMQMFKECYLPDLFHAALLGLFFLVFERAWLAGLLLFLMLFLTRESTILLGASIIVLALYRSNGRLALKICLATVAGLAAVKYAGSFGRPNIHEMNDLVYMALKVPFNLIVNVTGIQLWANTIDYCTPQITFSVAGWLPLGSIKTIGVCEFNPMRPLTTVALMLTTFGVAPTLLSYHLTKSPRQFLKVKPFWLVVAVLYGILSFFLGVAIGSSVYRLIGSGWPAFWLTMPMILARYYGTDRGTFFLLVFSQVVTCWLSSIIYFFPLNSPSGMLTIIASASIMHSLCLKRMWGKITTADRPSVLQVPAPGEQTSCV
jgi:hypothetical protein